MTTDDTGGKLSIPPQIPKAVEIAIRRELRPLIDELTAVIAESKKVLDELKSNDGLTNLQRREELDRCRRKLAYAENRIKDLESALAAHMEVASRRGSDIKTLEDKIALLSAEVGLLRSSIDNSGAVA